MATVTWNQSSSHLFSCQTQRKTQFHVVVSRDRLKKAHLAVTRQRMKIASKWRVCLHFTRCCCEKHFGNKISYNCNCNLIYHSQYDDTLPWPWPFWFRKLANCSCITVPDLSLGDPLYASDIKIIFLAREILRFSLATPLQPFLVLVAERWTK